MVTQANYKSEDKIMRNRCSVCGSDNVRVSMGGVVLCAACDPIVRGEIDKLRTAKKQVDVSQIVQKLRPQRGSSDYLMRSFPAELRRRAELRAEGEGISLKEIICLALEAYLK